ncbi:MAG: hypothetical protein JNM88_19640 [Chitinophagaceae bacterium]|nr:hypothetical protein [Chitinophagaceae bacterium]
MDNTLTTAINRSLNAELNAGSMEELRQQLTHHINHLINHDFDKLVQHLYRIDVSEHKVRSLLHQSGGENAAATIADLVIERQLQKIKTREMFKSGDGDIPGEEKW